MLLSRKGQHATSDPKAVELWRDALVQMSYERGESIGRQAGHREGHEEGLREGEARAIVPLARQLLSARVQPCSCSRVQAARTWPFFICERLRSLHACTLVITSSTSSGFAPCCITQ